MTETQKYLLKLLKEIDEICLAHDIEYYIFAGSMLGLERNEGVLPWDDDVDVVMTKKNYDRFAQVMKEHAPENRTFECVEENEKHPLQFGAYMNTQTSHITRSLAFNSSAGIWIDIMYVAPLPRDPRKMEKVKKWFCCYCELENDVYIEHRNHYKGFYWRYKLCRGFAALFGKQRVIRWMKKQFDYFPEEECDAYFLYHSLGADFRVFEKRFFEKPVRRNFGGVEVYASPWNRAFCRAGYGDSWMIVPKAELQKIHSGILDFEIPYYKYVEDYTAFVDKQEVFQNIKKIKPIDMKVDQMKRPAVQEKETLKGILLRERLKNKIRDEHIDLKALADAYDYKAIGELYGDYMELQFSRSLQFWKVFVPLEDDLLYPILVKLVCCDGEYYTADKILKLRAESGRRGLPEALSRLTDLVDICRQISIALWDDQDFEAVKHILENSRDTGFFCVDLELARLSVMLWEAEDKDAYLAVKARAEGLLEKLPNQGECMKLLADAEYELGNKETAMELYDQALEQTSNGLVCLDINRRKGTYRSESHNTHLIG